MSLQLCKTSLSSDTDVFLQLYKGKMVRASRSSSAKAEPEKKTKPLKATKAATKQGTKKGSKAVAKAKTPAKAIGEHPNASQPSPSNQVDPTHLSFLLPMQQRRPKHPQSEHHHQRVRRLHPQAVPRSKQLPQQPRNQQLLLKQRPRAKNQ